MDYIVLDLEWNQSIDADEKDTRALPFEIIEIGAVKLNEQKEIISEFSRLIKPVVYREMNHVTRKLIHLQMEELNTGDPFLKVMGDFLEWIGTDYFFCTWGPLDLMELQRNMRFFGIEPFSNKPLKFYDVQKLFSIAFEDKKLRRSLEFAADYLNIVKEIPFHRAFSDAYYTAKVLKEIKDPDVLKMFSFDVFELPKTKEEEIRIVFPGYEKYISREFEDKALAFEDKDVISTKCYICHKNLRRKIRWFSPNGKHYYSVAYCDVHGYVKGKIRLRRSENNKVYVVKTMKITDLEEVEKIRDRQDKMRIHRRIKKHK